MMEFRLDVTSFERSLIVDALKVYEAVAKARSADGDDQAERRYRQIRDLKLRICPDSEEPLPKREPNNKILNDALDVLERHAERLVADAAMASSPPD